MWTCKFKSHLKIGPSTDLPSIVCQAISQGSLMSILHFTHFNFVMGPWWVLHFTHFNFVMGPWWVLHFTHFNFVMGPWWVLSSDMANRDPFQTSPPQLLSKWRAREVNLSKWRTNELLSFHRRYLTRRILFEHIKKTSAANSWAKNAHNYPHVMCK